MLDYMIKKQHLLILFLIAILLLFSTENVFATATEGGGLPFDSWFTKIQASITGPFAFAMSLIGMAVTGTILIFGGDLNSVVQKIIVIILLLSLLIAGDSLLLAFTGKGAEITAFIKGIS